MSVAALGLHSAVKANRPRRAWKQEQRRTDRKSPRFTPETLARIAENARILDVRVKELHGVLVALARAGKPVKVRTAIDAAGWPNEEAIRSRFAEVYGTTPKAYAESFKACTACGQLELNDACEGCQARRAIQEGAGR